MSTSSRWSPRLGAMKMTHALGAARNTEPTMRIRWRYAMAGLHQPLPLHGAICDTKPMKTKRDGEGAMRLHQR